MKNMKKLAAGFIAAAMAMTMSLSAFADVVVPTISTDKATLNIGTGITTVNGAQTTMMAYVVPGIITEVAAAPAYDANAHEIVALDQVDGATGIASVPVDANKLADGKTIVVKISGTDGNLATYLITMQVPVVTYTVTYDLAEGTVSGTNATSFTEEVTIADFFATVVAPAKEGYNFIAWTSEAGVAVDTASAELMSTLDANADKTVALTATYEQVAGSDPVIVVYGDVDLDGDFDIQDANAMAYYYAWDENMDGYCVASVIADVTVGDVDGDGDFDIQDANAAAYYYAWDENMDGYLVNEQLEIEA